MAKTIAVTGATGAQGGAVARVLLEAGWNVRGITRNTESDAAKTLKSQGAEVVQASFDDEGALTKAFEGAHAIFAVTNFWEHLFTGKTQAEAGEIERTQATTLARAACKVSSLEHYIWSTLPSATKHSDGKLPVPHIDYKAEANEIIKRELPDLAKKTTFLVIGFYPSNLAFLPFIAPFEWPGSYGAHIMVAPTPATASIASAGDMQVTPGIWVKAILERPTQSQGKFALINTETLTFGDYLRIWSEVTGKRSSYVECSVEDFVKVWGIPGQELAMQYKWGETVSEWWDDFVPEPKVSAEELGIDLKGIGTKPALEKLKAQGLLKAAS